MLFKYVGKIFRVAVSHQVGYFGDGVFLAFQQFACFMHAYLSDKIAWRLVGQRFYLVVETASAHVEGRAKRIYIEFIAQVLPDGFRHFADKFTVEVQTRNFRCKVFCVVVQLAPR